MGRPVRWLRRSKRRERRRDPRANSGPGTAEHSGAADGRCPITQPDVPGRPACYYCGCGLVPANKRTRGHWRMATRDHLQPRGRGGTDDPGNIRWACRCCNTDKGDRTLEEYRAACMMQGRGPFYGEQGEPEQERRAA